MSTRDNYTQEEWELLLQTVYLSAELVMAASPQGMAGLARESSTMFAAAAAALRNGQGYDLIADLAEEGSPPAAVRANRGGPSAAGNEAQPLPGEMRLRDEMRDEMHVRSEVLSRCRRAAAVLGQRATPEEAGYFKHSVLWVCWQAAGAVREGRGFLRSNPVEVTEEEQEAIRQIAFALGLPASAAKGADTLPSAPPRAVPRSLEGRFTPAEWQVLRQAPVRVGLAVSLAAPAGMTGLIKELYALARALHEGPETVPQNQLVAAVVASLGQRSGGSGGPQAMNRDELEDERQAALDSCREVADLLRRKAEADEAQGFKDWLLHLGLRVAEASREGGFLGIGGKKVSAAEKALLEEIKAALCDWPKVT